MLLSAPQPMYAPYGSQGIPCLFSYAIDAVLPPFHSGGTGPGSPLISALSFYEAYGTDGTETS